MDFITDLIQHQMFLFTLILFLFGACVGSFLNVCIYRLPKEDASIVKPRSYCPACKAPIKWYDNIPILSYIVLQGKCRHCQGRISPQYVVIEVITGFLFVEYFILFGFTVKYFFYLYLTCSLLVATLVDFKLQIIPDEINYAGIVVGCIFSVVFPAVHSAPTHLKGLLAAGMGLVVGGGLIYITGVIGDFVFKKESMGGGDVKLMAMIGTFLGWKYTLLTFFLAPFFGSIVGIYIKFIKKGEIIPYGPFLSMAALVAVFAGERIVQLIF